MFAHVKCQMSNVKCTKAFTLLELLVTIAIMMILVGTGVSGLSRYRQLNELTLAADEVKDAIIQAQTLSLSPDRFDAKQYEIDKGVDATHYKIVVTTDAIPPSLLDIKNFTIRTGVTIISIVDQSNISTTIIGVYEVPTGKVISGSKVTLQDSNGKQIDITLDANGRVDVGRVR